MPPVFAGAGQLSSFAFPKRLRPPVFAGAGNPIPSPYRNGYAAGIRRCRQPSSFAFPKRLRRRCSQVRQLVPSCLSKRYARRCSQVQATGSFLPFETLCQPVFAGAGSPVPSAFRNGYADVRQGSALPQILKKTNGLCPWFGLGPNL